MSSDFHKNQVPWPYEAPNPPQIGPAAILKWWRHHNFFYIQHDFISKINKMWKFQINIIFQSKDINSLSSDSFVLKSIEK